LSREFLGTVRKMRFVEESRPIGTIKHDPDAALTNKKYDFYSGLLRSLVVPFWMVCAI